MKKLAVFVALFTMMSLSAKAQWFNFLENQTRAVFGVNTGLVGYKSVSDLNSTTTWNLSDVGVGLSVAIGGVYVDFLYVTPDHRFDSHVVNVNWDDHSALTINAGYQIPIYGDYVFITPMIGFSRVTTGYTEGNNIGIDPDSYSIYHKYTPTWHRHDFNYGGGITVVPSRWFEINATCTAHASYLGVAFNLMNFKTN